jgi:hypothetical protein
MLNPNSSAVVIENPPKAVINIEGEVVKLGVLLKTAFSAQKSYNAKKEGLSNELLKIAVECGTSKIFRAACVRAEAEYKAAHAKTSMPVLWTQSKSRIIAMFDEPKVVMVKEDGTIASFNECAKMLAKAKAEAKKAAEEEQPDHVRSLRALTQAIVDTADPGCIRQAVDMLQAHYNTWAEQHKVEPGAVEAPELAEVA